MGLVRTAEVGRRPAAFGGWPQTSLVEPALQGALHGQQCRVVLAAQEDADETGPPGRVRATHGDRLRAELLGRLGTRPAAAAVRRDQHAAAVLAAAVQQ
jgi:hypothetical protein